MGFLDEAVITARSGDGGKGCVSFRREKFIPKGGPDGGDGGDGGSIIVLATKNLQNLSGFNSRRYFRAPNGEHGKGRNRSGRNGEDLLLMVPLGTIISDLNTDEIFADLTRDNQKITLLPGGKGGKGNQRFATSTNRSPHFAQPGIPGHELQLRLTLKVLADIGLIGLPNAGKSTLLSRLSMARPKVDSYPFTTLSPNLGVMDIDEERSIVIADIPGLIKGASRGRGLGLRFLKHIERTRLLLHLLDITSTGGDDILWDFHTIRRELEEYSPELVDKPFLVLINKVDLKETGGRDMDRIKKAFDDIGVKSIFISALTGKGIERVKSIISEIAR